MLNGVSASQLQRDFNEFAQQASEKSSKQEVAAVRIRPRWPMVELRPPVQAPGVV